MPKAMPRPIWLLLFLLCILLFVLPSASLAQNPDSSDANETWSRIMPRSGFGYGGLLGAQWSSLNGQIAVHSETGIQYFNNDLVIEGERRLTDFEVGQVVFSPNMHLVALEEYGGLLVRDTHTWEPILALGEYGIPKWSGDSKYLAMWAGGGLRIWDVENAVVALEVNEFASDGGKFEWSPDGTVIAVSGPGAIALINVQTGNIVRIHDYDNVRDFEWSPNGRWILVVGVSEPVPADRRPEDPPVLNKLERIDAQTGEIVFRYNTVSSLNPHHVTGVGDSVAVSPDGRFVAADLRRWAPPYHTYPLGRDPGLGIWDLESGRRVYDFMNGNPGLPSAGGLLWSPDGNYIATTTSESVLLYDVRTQSQVTNLAAFIYGTDQVVWMDEGEHLVAAGGLWDVSGGVPVYEGYAPSIPQAPSRSKPQLSFLNPDPALFDYDEPPYEWWVLQVYEDRGLVLTYEIDIEYPGTPEYEDDIPPDERYVIWDIDTQQRLEEQVNLGEQTAWLYDLDNAYERANGNTIFNIQRTTRFVSIGDDEIVDLRTEDVTLYDLNKWEYRQVWFSPQGERIYTYDNDDRFKALDPVTGELLYQTVPALSDSFEFTPDLQKFWVRDDASTVYIYDAFSGELLLEAFTGDSYPALLWNDDFTKVAIGGDSNAVSIWSIPDKQRIALLRGHKAPIIGMSWNTDCDQSDIETCKYVFASTDSAGRVLLWGVETDEIVVQDIPEYPADPTTQGVSDVVDFSTLEPLWTYVVENETFGREEATSVSWDSDNICVNGIYHYNDNLEFIPDDKDSRWRRCGTTTEYIHHENGTRLTHSGTVLGSLVEGNQRTVGRDRVLDAAFSPDGTRVVTAENIVANVVGQRTGWLREWGVESGRQFAYWGGGAPAYNQIEWSLDGRWIVTATISNFGSGGRGQIWDANTRELTASLVGHTDTIVDLFFYNDIIVTASVDGTVRQWNTAGEEINRWEHPFRGVIKQVRRLEDEQTMMFIAGGDLVQLDLATLDVVRMWEGVGGRSYDLSPDGTEIIALANDAVVRILDFQTGTVRAEERRHMPTLTAIDWHPTGNEIALSRQNGSIVLIDAEVGGVDIILRPFGDTIRSMKWDATGEKLLVELLGGAIQLVDGYSGEVLTEINNEWRRDGAWWSPDGQYIALGTYPDPDDGVYTATSQVEVYDATTGELVQRMPLDWDDYSWYWEKKPFALNWSSDGQYLVAFYGKNRIRSFDVANGTVIDTHDTVGRVFSLGTWQGGKLTFWMNDGYGVLDVPRNNLLYTRGDSYPEGSVLRPDGEVLLAGNLIIDFHSGFPLQYLDGGTAVWNPICFESGCKTMIAIVRVGTVTMYGFPQPEGEQVAFRD